MPSRAIPPMTEPDIKPALDPLPLPPEDVEVVVVDGPGED